MQPEPVIPAGLPGPDAAASAQSARTREFIRERIAAAGGAISFGEFMQHALYAPGVGYYTGGAPKFGAAGDFVTAPEVSPLFGGVLARQCAQEYRGAAGAELLELGAGSGALAVSMLRRLASLDALPERYLILEVSAELAERQRRRIEEELPEHLDRVAWIAELPRGMRGVIVANEVADALPVERFERAADGCRQLFVTAADDAFAYAWRNARDVVADRVAAIESSLGHRLPDGYRSEVSLGLHRWAAELVDALDRGIVFLFDYGLPRREYYAADRHQGWLRCHFRHHAHDEPLIYPGIQDITSWVDFSTVAEGAAARNATVLGFVTQAMFLLNGGLDNEFSELAAPGPAGQVELAAQVRRLTLPGEMGESFKCLGLARGDVAVPDAFSDGDRAHVL